MNAKALNTFAALISILPIIASAETIYNSKIIGGIAKLPYFERNPYFDKKYKGKPFSDAGTIQRYGKQNFEEGWYVQINAGDESKREFRGIYCVEYTGGDDTKFRALRTRYPEGTKVTISGTMIEWIPNDSTIRLNDFCDLK